MTPLIPTLYNKFSYHPIIHLPAWA